MTLSDDILRQLEQKRRCPGCKRPLIGQRQLAKEIGIDLTSLRRLLDGHSVRMSTLDKVMAWLDR